MLIIDYENLDLSLKYIKGDFISENRFLDIHEKDQLVTLKNNLNRKLDYATESEEKDIIKSRIEKVNDILKVHEDKLEKAIEYLKKPFSNVPDYPEVKINADYRKFLAIYSYEYLLSIKMNLMGRLAEGIDFSDNEEEETFTGNYRYIKEAIDFSLDVIELNLGLDDEDYPKIYRIMELITAISDEGF